MNQLRQYLKNEAGAAAIEFALVLPIYLLFIMGIIELGLVFWGESAVGYGTSCAARYAFVYPTSSAAQIQAAGTNATTYNTDNISYTVTLSRTAATITGTFTYTFIFLPLNPLAITRQVIQPFYTNS